MPQVGVHALITDEMGRILLVRRNYMNHDWIPPGGLMEEGESITSAVVREVLEETGFLIEPGDLIVVGSRPATNDVIIVFAASIIERRSVKVNPSEIAEINFFSVDNLPDPMKPEAKKLIELMKQGKRGQVVVI